MKKISKTFALAASTVLSVLIFSTTALAATFSSAWVKDNVGIWHVKNAQGAYAKNVWFCDDAVPANGKNVWYLIDPNGNMVSAGLVKDGSGNYFSLETNNNGYFGMMRNKSGYYNCNGQNIYLQIEENHTGSYGAVNEKYRPDFSGGISSDREIHRLIDLCKIKTSKAGKRHISPTHSRAHKSSWMKASTLIYAPGFFLFLRNRRQT